MDKTYDVAVVGATGAVGEAMLEILAGRGFPIGKLYPLAGEGSLGKRVEFRDRYLSVLPLADFDFSSVQIALFSAGAAVSAEYAPRAAAAGAVVIDNTSQFRMEPEVPLVVPEVNPAALAGFRARNIIANPNCSTIQLVVALKPIHDAVGVERVNVATYQAVSGAGRRGMEELGRQTADLLNMREIKPKAFPRQIAFNVLPQIGEFEDNGYTGEELKIVRETRRILGDDSLPVNPTAVRVPVFYGHAEAVHLETREKLTAEDARELLARAPGVRVMDVREAGGYPTPVTEAAHHDEVFVGRIREDISHPRGLNFWIVADNVRKGAALNSVQLAELLIRDYL